MTALVLLLSFLSLALAKLCSGGRIPHYFVALSAVVGCVLSVRAQSPDKLGIVCLGPTALAEGQTTALITSSGEVAHWYRNGIEIINTPAVGRLTVSEPGYYTVRKARTGVESEPLMITRLTGKNASVTETIRVPSFKTEAHLDASGLSRSQQDKAITYVDGLGRPLQRIEVQASASGNDVVQPFRVDPSSTSQRAYLPYTGGTAGEYQADWEARQQAFYEQTPYVGKAAGGATYVEATYEPSPLGHLAEQANPGYSWSKSQGHTKRFLSRRNEPQDGVQVLTYAAPSTLGQIGAPGRSAATAASLQAQETWDEDNHRVVTFTDGRGLLISKRIYADAQTYLETSFAYDAAGRLVLVLPPEATRAYNTVATADLPALLTTWAFLYVYDDLGREIARKLPGKAWSYTVYDRWDRIVAFRDGNLGRDSKWRYFKYDELNRPIITGLFSDSRDQRALSGALEAGIAAGSYARHEVSAVTRTGTVVIGYSLDRTFPVNPPSDELSSITYYDNYDFLTNGGSLTQLRYAQEPASSGIPSPEQAANAPVGTITITQTRLLGSSDWVASAYHYDERGRLIQTRAQNHKGGLARSTTQYDFEGKLVRSFRAHTTSLAQGNHALLLVHKYDAKGRLREIYQTIDSLQSGTRTRLAAYDYNELGQLVDKKLGYDPLTNSYLQSVDYRYNIRGWLERINDRDLSGRYYNASTGQNEGTEGRPFLTHTPNDDSGVAGQDLFGLELNYDRAETAAVPPSFNGNISTMIWRSRSNNKLRSYSYSYDQADRLTSAGYAAYNPASSGAGANWWGETSWFDGGWFTLSGLTYDHNGNVKSLNRNGNSSINASGEKRYGAIDRLTFSHSGNQLRTVTDAVSASASNAPNDFENGGSTAEYEYDPNGNMIVDPNKGIRISYNELNLPAVITFARGGSIRNTYSAAGEKLQSIITYPTGAPQKEINYVDGFVYGRGTHLFVGTPEGRALYEPNRTASDKWVYEYHLRDHLGSLRLAFRRNGRTLMRASMEQANQEQEEQQFTHLDETRQLDATHAYTGQYAARLNARANRAQGPATSFRVSAGDSIAIEAFGTYDAKRKASSLVSLFPVAAAGNQVTLPQSKEIPGRQRRLVPTIALGISVAWATVTGIFTSPDKQVPRASLTYELYDKDSVLVVSKTVYLDKGQARDSWQKLEGGLQAKEDGYMRVSLANASDQDVWFDNLQTTVTPDVIVQENHYDPFGQNLVDIETQGIPDDKWQFTDQEKLDDLALNLLDYESRLYDYQIARFISTDEDAENYFNQSPYNYCFNNPIIYNDPDGRNPVLLLAALAGGSYNVYNNWDKIAENPSAGIGYFLNGAGGGVMAMFHPVAGLGMIAGGNMAIDAMYGHGPNWDQPDEYLPYLAEVTLGALGTEGAATMGAQLGSTIKGFSGTQRVQTSYLHYEEGLGLVDDITVYNVPVKKPPTFCQRVSVNNTSPVRISSYSSKLPKGRSTGGRLGKASTRKQNEDIAAELERRGWTVTHGAGRGPEEYLEPLTPGRKGGSYPDITAQKNGRTLRVNTVDTRKNGKMTTREANNAARIRKQRPGDHLLIIPK